MATAEEVRDALFERIAYHAISADIDEVLTLAKAYSLLDDEEDDEDEEDDD
jgi:SOS response regulatory protein OraA/RecX